MSQEPGRSRLTLADLIILVAATAPGLVWTQFLWNDLSKKRFRGAVWSNFGLAEKIVIGAEVAFPCVAMWSLAVGLLRFRRPYPRWRRVILEPGTLACVTAVGALLANIVAITAAAAFPGQGFRPRPALFIMFLPLQVGCAVAASWMTLVLGRQWRPVPTWIDRAGRGLGIYWIVLVPVGIWVLIS